MQMIIAVVRPNKIDVVKNALLKLGIMGMTAIEAKGIAKQMGEHDRSRHPKLDTGFMAKICLLICVKDTEKDAAVKAIIETARTGEVGDGKLFVLPVPEVVRIRTGERDEAAL